MKTVGDLRILIARIPYAEGNIGEEAILASLLQDLVACGVKNITVLSNQPERTRNRHGDKIRVIPDFPINWIKLPSEVREADLVIWGGGHMLQDRSSQLYIPYVARVLLLAKFLGVPRFIYAPGLGPVVNHFGRFLSRRILKGSGELAVRDDGSAGFLYSIGIQHHFTRTADPVFSLRTPADQVQVSDESHQPLIGVAPRRHFYRKGSFLPMSWQKKTTKSDNPRWIAFIREFAFALDRLIEEKNARIQFFPMDIGPNPRDDLICRQIRELMRHGESAELFDDDPPLDEFVRRLGGLDLLISARLHGIILGLRFGLPFIGIDSDGKIPILANTFDSWDSVIEDENLNRNSLFALADSILKNRQKKRHELRQSAILLRERAGDNRLLLRRCLNTIVDEK